MDYKEVAEKISNLGETLIVSDNDLDGLMSASLLKIILNELNNKNYNIIIRKHSDLDVSTLEKHIKRDINSIVLLDSPYDDGDLIKLSENYNDKIIMYIDHHKREIPENLPKNLIWFDIRSLGFNVISTAGILYRIGKILFDDFGKYSILAAAGAIGDFMFKDDSLVREDFQKHYPTMYDGVSITISFVRLINLFEHANPKSLVDYIEYLFVSPEIFFVNVLKNSKKYVRNNYRSLAKLKKIYESEKFIVYKSDSSSFPSTILSTLLNKIVLVVSYDKKSILDKIFHRKYKLSIRNNTNIRFDCGVFIKNFTKKYGIDGGGHPNAAGGVIKRKDLSKLIEELEKLINVSY